MKQFNRFIDPKKDLGSFSGMVCLYLLVMVFVSIISTFVITPVSYKHLLEQVGLRGDIIAGVEAAYKRTQEMGQEAAKK